MIHPQFGTEEDLMDYLRGPATFEPVRYKHIKRGTIYTVVSDREYHLNTFSEEGSIHEFVLNGKLVYCELQFSGDGTGGRYAGLITVYVGEDGKYWMRPHYEFHQEGRFEKL